MHLNVIRHMCDNMFKKRDQNSSKFSRVFKSSGNAFRGILFRNGIVSCHINVFTIVHKCMKGEKLL